MKTPVKGIVCILFVCLSVCFLTYLESPRLSTSSGRCEVAPAPPLLASLRGLVAEETGAIPPIPPPSIVHSQWKKEGWCVSEWVSEWVSERRGEGGKGEGGVVWVDVVGKILILISYDIRDYMKLLGMSPKPPPVIPPPSWSSTSLPRPLPTTSEVKPSHGKSIQVTDSTGQQSRRQWDG